MTPQTTILKDCSDCFSKARLNLMEGARLLYQIQEEKLYEGRFSSFGEYVEQELKVSQSFAAKLCKAYHFYAIEGGYSIKELQGIDSEKLYLSMNLPGNTEEKLEKAKLLSRSEIKSELNVKEGKECEHITKITICASCHSRVS